MGAVILGGKQYKLECWNLGYNDGSKKLAPKINQCTIISTPQIDRKNTIRFPLRACGNDGLMLWSKSLPKLSN